MKIHILSSEVTDNYFYLLTADDSSDGALIDPVDAEVALRAVESNGVHLRYLVNTHGHPDHTRGNGLVKEKTGAVICAHEDDRSWVGAVDQSLSHGDVLKLGDETLSVLHTPGHTPGHISLYTPGHLFCGDTIFVAGAGNCRFGGDPRRLYRTFVDTFDALPDDTLIYPGHDYAATNLKFSLALDPGCRAARDKLEQALETGGHCLATLREERSYNPFARVHEVGFQEALRRAHPEAIGAGDDPEKVFVAVRGLRDNW